MIRPPMELASAALLPTYEVAGEATYDPADAKSLEKYLARHRENKILGLQMGLYFYQLCKMRNSMGRPHLTKLLNEQRQERLAALKALKETRNDKRKDPDRKGRGRVRGDGDR